MLFEIKSADELVLKAKLSLLESFPFIYYVLMNIQLVPKENSKNTYINWRGRIKYNPRHYEETLKHMGEEQALKAVTFELAHEGLHFVLKHCLRYKELKRIYNKEDLRLFNICADIVVNTILEMNGIKCEDCVIIRDGKKTVPSIRPKFVNGTWIVKLVDKHGNVVVIKDTDKKSAEEILFELKQQNFEPAEGGYEDTPDPDDLDDDDGEDGQGGNEDGQNGGGGSNCSIEELENKIREILNSAYMFSKQFGKDPLGIDRYIRESLDVEIDWRKVLRRELLRIALSQEYDLQKPHPKSEMYGYIIPSTKGEHFEGLIAIDTSGSITDKIFDLFISAINKLTKQIPSFKITLVSCDAKVQTEQEIRDQLPKEIKAKGGGGTDFRPVFELAKKKHAKVVVYLTDGYGEFPEKTKIPTIWVVPEGGAPKSAFPFGVYVILKEKMRNT